MLGAHPGLLQRSCGFVGVNDGAAALADNYQLDWQFTCAHDGTISLTGELDLSQGSAKLALAFGEGAHNAIISLTQSLSIPFEEACERFIRQWERGCTQLLPLAQHALDHHAGCTERGHLLEGSPAEGLGVSANDRLVKFDLHA